MSIANRLVALGASFFLSTASYAQDIDLGKSPSDYELYKPDFSALKANGNLYEEYMSLGVKAKNEGFSRAIFQRRVAILDTHLQSHPKDVDVLWKVVDDIMRLGESYDAGNPDELTSARELLTRAEKYSERCMKLAPDLPLCQFYLAASIGKIATIDGIFASLFKARPVWELWEKAYNSKYDYQFDQGYHLQGLVRYAMGIYYRVVPDSVLLKWTLGISGDLKQSVALHREVMQFKGNDGPCSRLELGVSMLCETGGDKDEAWTKEAFATFDKMQKHPTKSKDTLICINDAARIRKDPSLACGYTKAKQQETDEEKMKAELAKQEK